MKKLFLLSCTIFLLVPLFAEDSPFSSVVQPTSNTFNATQGIMSSDADKFMDVADFSTLGKESILFLGLEDGTVDGGYAASYNNLYLGVYYKGYVVDLDGLDSTPGTPQNTTNHKLTTEVETDPIFDDTYTQIGEIETETTYYGDDPTNRNEFDTKEYNVGAVILGFGNIGVQLSFEQNLSSKEAAYDSGFNYNQDKEVVVSEYDASGNLLYRDSTEIDGTKKWSEMIPAISVGSTIATDSITIKPRLNFAYKMNQDNGEAEETSFTTVTGTGRTIEGMSDVTAYSYNSLNQSEDASVLDGDISAEFVLDKGDSVITFGIGYGLNKPLYKNSYDGQDGDSESVDGTSWYSYENSYDFTNGPGIIEQTEAYSYGIDEITEITHTINPMVKMTKDVTDRLTLGAKLRADVTLWSKTTESSSMTYATVTSTDSTDTSNSNNYTTEKVTTNPVSEEEESSMSIIPVLDLGMQYQLIPSRLTLNAGVAYTIPGYTKTASKETNSGYWNQTTTTTYADGTESSSYTEMITNSVTNTETNSVDWTSLALDVNAGLMFNITDDVRLDLLMNSGTTSVDSTTFTTQLVISK